MTDEFSMGRLLRATLSGRRLAKERGEVRHVWPVVLWDMACMIYWRGVLPFAFKLKGRPRDGR